MAKLKKPAVILDEIATDILKEAEHWVDLYRNGGADPFWPDGTNLNLTRNHIIYYKRQILELCEENNLPVPDAFYTPVPPTVPENYMANLRQTARVERLRFSFGILTTKRTCSYDPGEYSMF